MSASFEDTPVIILAGGLGTRLQPALPDQPKGLAPIGEEPFLAVQIQLLRERGARRFVLCIGHRADQIRAALGEGCALGVHIEYSLEEEGQLLGTAGALKKAERHFAPHALVLNGDTYFDIDYALFLQRHVADRKRRDVLATLALARLADRAGYGNVALDPSEQTILTFREKAFNPAADASWVSAGAYVIERALLDYVSPGQPRSLEHDVFPRILTDGRTLAAMTFTDRFFDIGTPDAWRQFVAYYSELPYGKPRRVDPTAD